MKHGLTIPKCNEQNIQQSMFSQVFVSGQMSTHTSNLQEQVVKTKPRAKEQTTRRWKSKEYGTVNRQKNPKRPSAKENTTTKSMCQSSIKASRKATKEQRKKDPSVKTKVPKSKLECKNARQRKNLHACYHKKNQANYTEVKEIAVKDAEKLFLKANVFTPIILQKVL